MNFATSAVLCSLLCASGAHAQKVESQAPAGTATGLSFNACHPAWSYIIDESGAASISAGLQGTSGNSPDVTLIISSSATAATLKGTQDGGVWSFELHVPAFGNEQLSNLLHSGHLFYVSIAFKAGAAESPAGTLVLTQFSIIDTNRPC